MKEKNNEGFWGPLNILQIYIKIIYKNICIIFYESISLSMRNEPILW